jgi:hypothetical protein
MFATRAPSRRVSRQLTILGSISVWMMAGALGGGQSRSGQPSISDAEYWRLTEALSEEEGYYGSDNLVSTERGFAEVVATLKASGQTGGVYIGVGPEQNFHYIAAGKPSLAFIVDIRRANLRLHLMYRALFELSADRAEFLCRLFGKQPLRHLTTPATLSQLIERCWLGDDRAADDTLSAILQNLQVTHRFPLSTGDRQGIAEAYGWFTRLGPHLAWFRAPGVLGNGAPSYGELMVDQGGDTASYLASESSFAFIKRLEQENRIVPVVGDFAGPRALRAVGQDVERRALIVQAFYLSDVEPELKTVERWRRFCANAATLPVDEHSVFIRESAFRPLEDENGTAVWPPFAVNGTGLRIGPLKTEMQRCQGQ